jgi:hypothetical protein
MKLRRAATLTLTLLALSLPINPPPGHGGIPPGQAKKI